MNTTTINALLALASEAESLAVYFPALRAAAEGDCSAVTQIRWYANNAPDGTAAAYFSGKALEILDA